MSESLTLKSLIYEKAVRYADVVSALEGHLPEDEAEAAAAIKKLSNEMKIKNWEGSSTLLALRETGRIHVPACHIRYGVYFIYFLDFDTQRRYVLANPFAFRVPAQLAYDITSFISLKSVRLRRFTT